MRMHFSARDPRCYNCQQQHSKKDRACIALIGKESSHWLEHCHKESFISIIGTATVASMHLKSRPNDP